MRPSRNQASRVADTGVRSAEYSPFGGWGDARGGRSPGSWMVRRISSQPGWLP